MPRKTGRCQKNGCRKKRRGDGDYPQFCKSHGGGTTTNQPSPARGATRLNAVKTNKKQHRGGGHISKFRLNPKIMSLAEKMHLRDNPKHAGKAVRELIEVDKTTQDATTSFANLTNSTAKQAQEQQKNKFPLKNYEMLNSNENCVWLVASGKSRSHTRGKIHRDQSNTGITGCYQFLLLMHDIDNDGGGIRIWPNTTATRLIDKCRSRHIPDHVKPVRYPWQKR